MVDGETPSTSKGFSAEFETSLTLLKSLRESRFSSLATALESQIDSSGLVPDRIDPDGNFHKQSLKEYLHLRGLRPVQTVQSLVNDGKWKAAYYQALAEQRNKENNNQVSLLRRRALGQLVAPKSFYSGHENFRFHYRIFGHAERTYNVRFDRSGQYILTGSDDTLVKVWDMSQSMLRYTFRGSCSVVADMDISFCNQFMVTAGSDKSVRIWNLQNGAMLQVYKSHSNSICRIYFLPKVCHDRRWIVSFGNDCNVIFYEFDGKQRQFDFRRVIFNVRTAPGLKVLSGTYSSCGDWVAAGDSHGYVHLFRFLEEHDNYQVDLDFKAIPAQEKLDTLEWAHSDVAFVACSSRHHIGRVWRFIHDSWHFLDLAPQLLDKSMKNILHSTKLKYGISMAVWSLDDTKIVVSGADFKVRIFDAVTAKELHCLDGHKSFAYHLKIHPTHPNVVVSLGHDGLILIWDIEKGKQLKMFTNQDRDNDGDIVSTAILDCAFSPDSTRLAIVDDTGRLSVYGYGGNEHLEQTPKEQFFSSDYSPTISDENDFPIDVDTGHEPHLNPPPWMIDIHENPLDERWQKKVPGRESNNEVGELECAWKTRSIIPRLSDEVSNQWVENQIGVSAEKQRNLSIYDSRFDQYKATGSEEPAPPKPTTSRRRAQLPTLDELVREQRERRLQINDYRSEDDEDYNASEEGEEQRPQADSEGEDSSDESYGGRNSSHEENTEHAEQDQQEEEVEVVRTSSGRQSRPPRMLVVAQENRAPQRRRNRTRHTVEAEDHMEDESSRDVPLHEEIPGPSEKPSVKEKKGKINESQATFPLIMHEVRQRRFPYFPQVGDSVVYFKQGHQAYLDDCQLKNYYQITKKMQPPANAKAEEFCTIVDVKYTLKPYRLTCVRLKRNDDRSVLFFNVKFHDAAGCVDFIILRQIYDRAIASKLEDVDAIEAIFDSKWYTGSVVERSDADVNYPGSNWNCMRLRWDNGDGERMSPWEIQAKTPGRLNDTDVSEDELLITYVPSADDWPGTNHLPERNMQEHCSRLVAAINQLSGNATVGPFANPVCLREYPDYAHHVAYCIDLSTICQRLNNKFYRRLTAVQHDIRHIAVAAEQFNEADSVILKNSRMLVEALIRFSNDTSLAVCDFVTFYDSMFDLASDEVVAYRAPKLVSQELLEMAAALPAQEEVRDWRTEARRILESVFNQAYAKLFYDKNTVADNSIRTALNEEGDLKSVVDELETFNTPEEVIARITTIINNCLTELGRDGGQRRTHDSALKVVKTVEQKMKAVVDEFKACMASVELNGFSVRRNLRKRVPKQSTYQTRSHRSETTRGTRSELVYNSEEPSTVKASAAESRTARVLRRTVSGETSSSAARESTTEPEIPARRCTARGRAARSPTGSPPTSDAEEMPAASRGQRRTNQRRREEQLDDELRDILEDNEERLDREERSTRNPRKRKHRVSDSEEEYLSGSSTRSRPTRSTRRLTRNRRETSSIDERAGTASSPISMSSFGRVRRPRNLD